MKTSHFKIGFYLMLALPAVFLLALCPSCAKAQTAYTLSTGSKIRPEFYTSTNANVMVDGISSYATQPLTVSGGISTPTLSATNATVSGSLVASNGIIADQMLSSGIVRNTNKTIPQVIIDSDVVEDIGDPMALYLAGYLHAAGEINIIAAASCVTHTTSAPALSAILNYWGVNCPIGTLKNIVFNNNDYMGEKLALYPNSIVGNSGVNALNATNLYRSVLASMPDASVTFCSIGQLTNVYNLYNSPADSISPLTGAQLFNRKVKEWVVMGGQFPSGSEYNFYTYPLGTDVLMKTSVPITYSGYSLGSSILAGNGFYSTWIDNPIRQLLATSGALWGNTPREQWDSINFLYIARGLSWGATTYFGTVSGAIVVNTSSGANTWNSGGSGQKYLTLATSSLSVSVLLDSIYATTPQTKNLPSYRIGNAPTQLWTYTTGDRSDVYMLSNLENAPDGTSFVKTSTRSSYALGVKTGQSDENLNGIAISFRPSGSSSAVLNQIGSIGYAGLSFTVSPTIETTPSLNLVNTRNDSYTGMANLLATSLTSGNEAYLSVGRDNTQYNSTYLSFHYVGNNSASNYGGIGMSYTGYLLSWLPNGDISIPLGNLTVSKNIRASGASYSSTATSSAITMTSTSSRNFSFTGSTATWTLSAVSASTGQEFVVKNRGSGNLTVVPQGADSIYNISATTSHVLTPGDSAWFINDGTYWNLN